MELGCDEEDFSDPKLENLITQLMFTCDDKKCTEACLNFTKE